MKIETKKGSYYVYLPSMLYNKIVELAKDNDNINLGLLAFLLNQILHRKFEDKNLENGSKWVSVCSSIIRQFNFKDFIASKHLDLLIEQGVLESLSHINGIVGKNNSCKKFRIVEEYFNDEENSSKSSYEEYMFTNETIVSKYKKNITQRKAIADYKTEHLTKLLNQSDFTMDKEKATDYINSKYSKKEDEAKRFKRQLAIRDFESSIDVYSRSGKDDRLHTYFTALPSDLKQFITYNRCALREADIKSSQPFILSFILGVIQYEYNIEMNKCSSISLRRFSNRLYKCFNSIINTYEEEDYRLDIRSICKSITIMLQESSRPIDFTEINKFISLVQSGRVYEVVGEALFKQGSISLKNNKYVVRLFDKESNSRKWFEFETLRKCAKKVTINALYGSPSNIGVDAIEHFKLLFPQIAKYLKAMKINNKADLPILMQRIESKCVLDYCSKKIANKHPKMLLISRHDSLSTTVDCFDILHSQFQKLLTDYFGVEVIVGKESW